MYAIGGSENPIINSEGNRFNAPDARFKKEVMHAIILAHGHNQKTDPIPPNEGNCYMAGHCII